MKTHSYFSACGRWLATLAAVMLPAVSALGDPIEMPEKSITPEISFLIGAAIFFEVICIWLMLRRSRTPRFFILWLVVMHLITYPSFLGSLWLLQNLRPAIAAGIGEGAAVVVEGFLIYFICQIPSHGNSAMATPSILKCLSASFIGNAVSALAFPVFISIYDRAF